MSQVYQTQRPGKLLNLRDSHLVMRMATEWIKAKQNCPTMSVKVVQPNKIFKDIRQYFCSIRCCKARFLWSQARLKETDRKADIIQTRKSHGRESKGSGHCPEHKLTAREWPVVGKLKQKHVFSIIVLPKLVSFALAVVKTCFYVTWVPLLPLVPREVSVKDDCLQDWSSGRGVCAYLARRAWGNWPEGSQRRVHAQKM